MARKRYISTEISIDKKVLELADSGFLAPLLYTWAIPHMDDWGRITGDTREFKALVCPGLDIMNKDVEEAINNIVKVDLWVRYEVEEKKCIAVAYNENWFKHQSYISKDKRINDDGSAFPRPPQNTEKHRELPRISEEQQESPQNPSSFSLSVSSSLSVSDSNDTTTTPNPFKLFESEGFGTLSSIIAEKLGDMIDTYGERWVIEGMKESVVHGVRNLAYLKSILERYKNSGIDKPWEAEKPKSKQTTFRNNQPKKDKLPMFKGGEEEPLPPEAKEAIKNRMRSFGENVGA